MRMINLSEYRGVIITGANGWLGKSILFALQKYLESTAEMLKGGAMAEMSGKIAHIMITRHGVPAVTNQEQVESMLGKSVEWIGRHPEDKYASRYGEEYEGWYSRNIGGGAHMKILLGGA